MLFPELLINKDPRAHVVQDVAQLPYWRNLLLDHAKKGMLSADSETDAFDPFRGGRIIAPAFGFDPNDGYGPRGVYFPIRHRTADVQLPIAPVLEICKDLLGNPAHRFVFQNAMFDLPFFRADGIEVEAYIDDTLIAGHLLDENADHELEDMCVQYDVDPHAYEHRTVVKRVQTEEAKVRRLKKSAMPGYAYIPVGILGPYGCKDVYNGLKLAQKILPRAYERYPELYATELVVLRAFEEMTWEGVEIDVPYLLDLHKRTQIREALATKKIRDLLQLPNFDPSSNDQVRHLIYEQYRLPVYDLTESKLPSVGAYALKEIRHFHPEYKPLMDAFLDLREAEKILSTYTEALIRRTDERGILHSKFRQNGARTGRSSSADPNLQNISSDDEDTIEEADSIRQAFRAPKDKVRCCFDWSQVQLRALAYRAQEPTMTRAFLDKRDIHLEVQIALTGDTDKKSPRRRRMKVLNFGTLFGMTPRGIARTLNEAMNPDNGDKHTSEEEATEWFNEYHRRFPRIGGYTRELVESARRRSPPSFDSVFGRTRHMPDLNDYRDWVREGAIRKLVASDIQGMEADIVKRSVARCYLHFKEARKLGLYDARMKNLIHDDLWVDVDPKGAPQCAVDMKYIMENHPEIHPVPIVADAEWIMPGEPWTNKVPVWEKH